MIASAVKEDDHVLSIFGESLEKVIILGELPSPD